MRSHSARCAGVEFNGKLCLVQLDFNKSFYSLHRDVFLLDISEVAHLLAPSYCTHIPCNLCSGDIVSRQKAQQGDPLDLLFSLCARSQMWEALNCTRAGVCGFSADGHGHSRSPLPPFRAVLALNWTKSHIWGVSASFFVASVPRSLGLTVLGSHVSSSTHF